MNARLPRSFDQLPKSEQRNIYKSVYTAVYKDVARNAAQIVTKLADESASRQTKIAIECGLYAAMLSAIDTLGVGTDASRLAGRESRLQRFVTGFQSHVVDAGQRYDESIMEGLRYQLRVRGVELPEVEPHQKLKTIAELEAEISEAIKTEEEES